MGRNFFTKYVNLISVPMNYICQCYLIIASSLRKNDDSQRHDDVISMHSR